MESKCEVLTKFNLWFYDTLGFGQIGVRHKIFEFETLFPVVIGLDLLVIKGVHDEDEMIFRRDEKESQRFKVSMTLDPYGNPEVIQNIILIVTTYRDDNFFSKLVFKGWKEITND
jgi:hypothetical protein